MELFANDQSQAELAVRMPTGETATPPQPPGAQETATPRQAVLPSSEDTERALSDADTTSDRLFDNEKIRYRHEVHKYTLGWPRFAATHEARHNGGLYRRFGYLISRRLLYKQGRLDNLQHQLEECENDPATDPKGLSAGQTRRVGEEYTPDRLDLIQDELEKEMPGYLDLLIRDRDTQALFRAHDGEVVELYEHATDRKMIEGPGRDPAREISDFVYTRPKLEHNALRGLVHSNRGRKLLRRPLGGRRLSSAAFARGLQVLVVTFGALMLLIPTGLMYLLELSNAASYGLVVGFVVVFSVAFVAADAAFEHVLLGTCAYVAVLIDILVQTQGRCGGVV